MQVTVKVLAHGRGLLPGYQSAQAAGLDLHAALAEGEEVTVEPGKSVLLPCGFCMALPVGFEAQVRPRSGLALRNQITVLNSPGTVDSDYRGEIGVILINHGSTPFTVTRGDRIAQMVITRHERADLIEAEELDETDRGGNGYGSTGVTKTL